LKLTQVVATMRSIFMETNDGRYAIFRRAGGVDCRLELNATIFNFSAYPWHEAKTVVFTNEGYFPCFIDTEIKNKSNCEIWSILNESFSRVCVNENHSFFVQVCPNSTYQAYAEIKIKILAGSSQPDFTLQFKAKGYDIPVNTTHFTSGNWYAVYWGSACDSLAKCFHYKNDNWYWGEIWFSGVRTHKTVFRDCFGRDWICERNKLKNCASCLSGCKTIELPEHNDDRQAFTLGPKYATRKISVYAYVHPGKIAEIFWDSNNLTTEDIIIYDFDLYPTQLYWDGSINRILIADDERIALLIPNSGGSIDTIVDAPGPVDYAARDVFGRYWLINESGHKIYIFTANLDFVKEISLSSYLRFATISENSYNDIVIITKVERIPSRGTFCNHAIAFYASDDYEQYKVLKTLSRCFFAATWHKEWVLTSNYCKCEQWHCAAIEGLNLYTGERGPLPTAGEFGFDDHCYWLFGDPGLSKWRSWDWNWSPSPP